MNLSENLSLESVRIPLSSHSKDEVLHELVELLPSSGEAALRDRLHQAVVERENRMSTGIGQGIAIPHGKSEAVSTMEVAFGIARPAIEFDALDGQPVSLFFLLVSPPDLTGPHIKALAQISRMLSSDSARSGLEDAKSAAEVLEVIRREEASLD